MQYMYYILVNKTIRILSGHVMTMQQSLGTKLSTVTCKRVYLEMSKRIALIGSPC